MPVLPCLLPGGGCLDLAAFQRAQSLRAAQSLLQGIQLVRSQVSQEFPVRGEEEGEEGGREGNERGRVENELSNCQVRAE